MTAPLESTTVPTIRPLTPCAPAKGMIVRPNRRVTTHDAQRPLRLILSTLLCFLFTWNLPRSCLTEMSSKNSRHPNNPNERCASNLGDTETQQRVFSSRFQKVSRTLHGTLQGSDPEISRRRDEMTPVAGRKGPYFAAAGLCA